MELIIHNRSEGNIAELQSKNLILNELQDFIDLLGNAHYQNCEGVIIDKSNLPEGFFDLKTRFAGEVLQKFSNYQKKLAVIGDFSNLKSKSLTDFITESNKGSRIIFISDKDKALEVL